MGKKRKLIDNIKEGWKGLEVEKLNFAITMQIDGIHLLAIHGACCLGLRHPRLTGPSRKTIIEFVIKAEEQLRVIGALTEKDIKEIHHKERQYSPHKDY